MPTEATAKPAPITNGAALTKALKAAGTGARKIDVCRAKLREVHESSARVATAREVVAALEESDAVGEVTVDKARALAGMPRRKQAVKQRDVAIEDRLLGEADAPELDLDEEEEEERAAEEEEEAAERADFVGPAKVPAGDGLEALTVAQLRDAATAAALPFTDKTRKAELVQALRAARAAQ
jgi:hypothetical protein